jgi:rubrerythrin
MAARDLVVKWFGEAVARKIEQFVDGTLFGDDLATCPRCGTPVAATFITERGECPICGAKSTTEGGHGADGGGGR